MRLNENYTFEGAADRCGQDLASFRCVSVYRMSRYGVPKSFRWGRKAGKFKHIIHINFTFEGPILHQLSGVHWDVLRLLEALDPYAKAGRRTVLLVRRIVRSVPLEIVGSSGHEKVPTRGKPGLERPGRPRGERDRRIVRQALVDPTVTRSTIRADVGVAIVPQTISRHLAEANLKSKRPFRALPLTPEHRQLRLQWCQARSMWNVDWQKVVFSDESRFVMGSDDNRVRVWRRSGERYNSPTHCSTSHCPHSSCNGLGAIAYDSRSTLIVMGGTLTGQRYVDDILRPHVGPFLNGLPGAIFQQDYARPHTSRVAQDFLRHFQILPWPARSPDLSPVEHVWDQLKRQMPLCHSVHDLELAVQDLCAHLPQDNIRCLINSIPDRVAACIAAGGGPTRY
ncbi:transposable element Tcb2 transposase [Trichonephila clavipes]|nr:transposable element Tcb2 transposase [Trichonephila clavipes]